MRGFKFLFLLVLVIVMLITSGYFIFKAPEVSSPSESELIEPSGKESMDELRVTLSRGYDISVKPTFEVGQKLVYEVRTSGGEVYSDEYVVQSIEHINSSDVFLIVNKKTIANNSGEELYPAIDEIYVDAYNGNIVKLVKKILLPSSRTVSLTSKNDLGESTVEADNYAYLPWMLGLREGVGWTTVLNFTVSYGDGYAEGKYEYTVVGAENINDMECFVVESVYSELDEKKNIWENHNKIIRWIDKKTRWLVKSEVYDYDVYGSLDKSLEINMISLGVRNG